MSQGEVVPNVSLWYYVDVLRRRWWLPLLCAALGLGLAAGYLAISPRVATATATVSVNVISTDPFNAARSASGLIDTAGEAQVASSYAVADRAAAQLGDSFPSELVRESVDVVGVADTAILRVSASADTEADARAIANAVATEFLEFRSEQAESRIGRTLQQSQERLEGLREDLREVDERIGTAEADSVEFRQAESDRALLTLEVNSVLSQVASTESIDTTGGTVLSPADRNPVSWSPPRTLLLLTGLVAGLGAGIIGAFVMHALGSRVRSARDVSQNGGRTVLGELMQKRVSLPPTGVDLGDFRALRERMLADPSLADRVGVMAVVDQCHGRGASGVAVNLAFIMALSGVRVEYVVLDADDDQVAQVCERLRLRRDVPSARGTTFVSDEHPSFSMFVPPTAGSVVADEPITSAVRSEVESRRSDRLVVLAVRGEATTATRLAACRLADASLLLLAPGVTRTAELHNVSQDVRLMGGLILGSVLVNSHRVLEWPDPAEATADAESSRPQSYVLHPQA